MFSESAKRFYKRAEVFEFDCTYGVALDGRSVRTPSGNELRLPSEALAEAVATEWQAQEDEISPGSMPLMQLACTAIDRVSPNRDAIIEQTAAYGGSDLLCYRSDGPDELVAAQEEMWQPVLDWAKDTLTAPLKLASGVMHVEQPTDSLAALRNELGGLDVWQLTAVTHMTQVMGSLLLALAVLHGWRDWNLAFEASVLDETFQASRWGEDREAMRRRKASYEEVRWVVKFLELSFTA